MDVAPARLLEITRRLLRYAGSHDREAEVVSDHLVGANLAGHDSHGVGLLPFYVRSIEQGWLEPNTRAKLLRDDGALLSFGGGYGYGQAVAREAMFAALERCRDTGLVLMTLRDAHHIGRVGTYGEQSIAAGFVSIHFVNVTDHDPLVAPYGGRFARYGTNPICVAMPGGAESPPILLDMATSTYPLGKTRVAMNRGETLPGGIVLDPNGDPSDDPSVMFQKPAGALLPLGGELGGHKGYGLAFVIELLAGGLSGGGTIQPGTPRRGGIVNNMTTIVIDPARLVEQPWLEHELDALVRYSLETPANAHGPVKLPGEPERTSAEARRDHVPIDPTTWSAILAAGERVGLTRSEVDAVLEG